MKKQDGAVLLFDVVLEGNYSWIHKEKEMLQYSLSASNFSLAEVTWIGKCEGHLGRWVAVTWTPQTQARFKGDTKLSWEEMWRWQVHLYILPLAESKILLNSREAVLFPWKPQSWFVSEWNASISLPKETVTVWRTGSTSLHRIAWILPKCGSLPLPPSPAWKLCIRNPTLLLLHLFGDQKSIN